MASENPVVAERALEPPERDRLFREWILPHLKLTEDHREFVESILHIPGAKDFHSFPGSVRVPLGEHAPVERLRKLTCCTISGDSELELAGPISGALLIPVTDPHGRLSAFRLLDNTQIETIKAGQDPGKVRWWYAASKNQPMLPNGDDPLHAVRYADSETVVLIRGIARASAVVANWKKSAISTVKPTFPVQVAFDYIRELCGNRVEIFIHREPTVKQAVEAWALADQLRREDLTMRMLVPVLSDLDFPKHYEECSALTIDTWMKGLPKELQQEIERTKRNSLDMELIKTSKQLSPEEVHGKLVAAYRDIMAEGRRASVGSLSEMAGVHWELALEWLKERGIDNTQVLQVKIEKGWIPDGGVGKMKKRPGPSPAELKTPTLFDLGSKTGTHPKLPDEPEAETVAETARQPAPEEQQDSIEEDSSSKVPESTADESIPTETDGAEETLPTAQGGETAPAKRGEASVADAGEKGDAEEEVRQEGTLELVVEAQESIFEGETPLTQTMPGPEAPSMEETQSTAAPETDGYVKLGIIVIIVFLIIAAISLVVQFGLHDDTPVDDIRILDERQNSLSDNPLSLPSRLHRDYRDANGNVDPQELEELTKKIIDARDDD